MFQRVLSGQIAEFLGRPGTAIILYGPRQAGKTTLLDRLLAEVPGTLRFTGDDLHTQTLLSRHELEHLRRIVGDASTLFIDEAQRIENIGLTLKLLVDHLSLTVIASGSASFDLAGKVNEPLTGRASTFQLYPLAWEEIEASHRLAAPAAVLETMLRYGMYPRVHTLESEREKEAYLYEYLNSYLYRDLLVFEQVRKPRKVIDLLVLLAYQIGREVSISELAGNLALSRTTVEGYLDVLEKMFVLVSLRGFSRNLRKEITKSSRYYFTDVGLRNALIRNFNPLGVRNDAGELFENWFVLERLKRAANRRLFTGFHFWRTHDQAEIDLVEERDGALTGYECKWSPRARVKVPRQLSEHYPEALFVPVTSENWMTHLD
ncbi:MAG: ATP-binding protein [Acidobacteria bacterium]|nr:ATP-binding protein [Acidobacteriota bacterium]